MRAVAIMSSMKKNIFILFFALLPLTAHSYSLQQELARWTKTQGSKVQRLNAFYKLHWNYVMVTYPEAATYQGYPGQNDRWSDRSITAIEKSKKDTKDFLRTIRTISEKGLKGEDLMNYRLFIYSLEDNIKSFQFPGEYIAIDQMMGIHAQIVNLFSNAPKNNLKDYKDMLARLKTSPIVIDQVLVLLQEGLKRKLTQPQVTLKDVPSQFDKFLNVKIEDHPLYEAFKEINPNVVAKDEALKIQAEAKDVITKNVNPSLKKLKDFLANEYIPQARQTIGWSTMPDGKNWYNVMINSHTTIDMTADQIFDLGQSEVHRIQQEMAKVREQLKFSGSAQKFHTTLSDSRFYFKTGDELIERYRSIGKLIDPELPKLFKKLPRLPYGVRELPAFIAPQSPDAYYEGGSLEAGRAGYFTANTYDLNSRPKWAMIDLTCHEAVPGHHFQISIAKEIEGLPDFRREMGYTSYSEGWALYAETLCDELGLYKDPYDKYGHLVAELLRAVRLVLDTGIHSKNWTREQAVNYFREAGPFSEREINIEVDRYIVWPGQALGYKIGQLKIKELREKLKAQLGEKFDVRAFHDEILSSGALPLPVLEKKMMDWGKVQEKRQAK